MKIFGELEELCEELGDCEELGNCEELKVNSVFTFASAACNLLRIEICRFSSRRRKQNSCSLKERIQESGEAGTDSKSADAGTDSESPADQATTAHDQRKYSLRMN